MIKKSNLDKNVKDFPKKLFLAMNAGGKEKAEICFGEGHANLKDTWECNLFTDYVKKVFARNGDYKNQRIEFEDFLSVEFNWSSISDYRSERSHGIIEETSEAIFNEIVRLRRTLDKKFSSLHLLLAFLEYCEKNARCMSIFYLEVASDIDVKAIPQNDPKRIIEANERLKHFTEELRTYLHGPLKKTEHFPVLTSDENWLSPLNDTFIPFVGREKEKAELDAFIKGAPDKEAGFQVWAIVAPSGAGKTRLLAHWANNDANNVLVDWEVMNLKSATEEDWRTWLPEHPTLICIDYIYGYDQVISDLVTRAEKLKFNFEYPVRLLLLDHATPDNMSDLLKDPRHGFESISHDRIGVLKEKVFFKPSPLKLEVLDQDDHFLSQIMCSVAYKGEEEPLKHLNDPDIQTALEYFDKEDESARKAIRQPLFAALVGDARIENGACLLPVLCLPQRHCVALILISSEKPYPRNIKK